MKSNIYDQAVLEGVGTTFPQTEEILNNDDIISCCRGHEMNFNRALSKEQTTCINGVFVLFVFLSHFGQYETMPWNHLLLAIGQLMVAPFLFYSGYGIMEQIQRRGIVYINSMPRKRILKFYIHFCMALFLYLILSFLMEKDYSLVRIVLSFTALSSIGNSNWYVFAILAMYSIVYISFKQFKRHGITSCIVFTILYIILMDIIKNQAWWYNIILCFPAGMILSKYKDWVCSIIQRPVFFIFLVVLALILYIFQLCILAYEIISIAFCFLIVDLCAYKEIKNSWFHFLGQYVFEIYILQRISMNLFDRYLEDWIYLVVCILFTLILAYYFKMLEIKVDGLHIFHE